MANIKRANTSGITKSGVAIPDVPDAPTIGAATNVGTSRAFNNGSATVAFTANPRGGTSTSFTATSTPGSFTATGAGSPLTVTGLQSATSYTFAVTGTNTTATGAASAASSSITATTIPATMSAPTPTNVGTSRAFNNGAASVAFTAPATGGAAISSYTVTSTPGSFTGTGSSSPITVTGQQSATAYTYTVTATNANGTSSASSASGSVTATTVPQAPTIGTATGGDTTASVTFTAGATGGSTITGYTVTSSPGGFTGTGASSPITVSGLTNGTAYTFTVTATNANGTSSASSASNSVTPALGYAYNSIASYLTNATTSPGSLQFTSIPQTYSHLQIRVQYRSSDTNGYADTWAMLINGNSSTIYNYHSMQTNNSNPSAFGNAQNSNFKYSNYYAATGSPGSGVFSSVIYTILDYASSSKLKTVRVQTSMYSQVSGAYYFHNEDDFIWNSTSPVTSIAWTSQNGDPTAGSTFALYGIS